jgi:uncharacterized protein YdeI (BOF family)
MSFYKPSTYKISEITDQQLDSIISLEGKVYSLNYNNKNLFFDLCNSGQCIKSVVFNYTNKQKQTLINSKNIKIIGKLEEYNNSYEIIVYSIKSI